jgi:hypothetical protein
MSIQAQGLEHSRFYVSLVGAETILEGPTNRATAKTARTQTPAIDPMWSVTELVQTLFPRHARTT